METFEPKISERQIGLLSSLFRDHRGRLPESWKNRAGYREGDADWRHWHFEKWAEANLTMKAASAVITALREENLGGAMEILYANNLPFEPNE